MISIAKFLQKIYTRPDNLLSVRYSVIEIVKITVISVANTVDPDSKMLTEKLHAAK